ncbi:hypothetical protein ACLIYM_13055 [Streptomyces fenghuangensis]|uniref:Uncharacterized protein n=1 Tax=Streptomyces chitinivorans TaxID=1257027 RepID=A0ABW7HZ19_9ACTN|nr:hypothetical protein [Streptomyces chitinivorans]MDH2411612.1 hypothetical protein [Streptomyces chitinivorans]
MQTFLFRCRSCRAEVTAPVREVPLPHGAKAPCDMPRGQVCPPRLPPGAFAAERFGEAGRGARGPRPVPVLNPGDLRGTRHTDDPARLNGCCGLDGMDGPNLLCARCGAELATESSDCWTWQQVALLPEAVERVTLPGRRGGR